MFCFLRRGDVSLVLSFRTRRELLQQMVPRYRQASAAEKGALLEEIAATTGYTRRYAMWLLNHPQEGQRFPRQRQRRYGPEVQQALFLAWHAANRICSKRLIPFLPTLIDALERHGHLQLSEACRSQLLSMSAACARASRCGFSRPGASRSSYRSCWATPSKPPAHTTSASALRHSHSSNARSPLEILPSTYIRVVRCARR
jgi:hypothetical protein